MPDREYGTYTELKGRLDEIVKAVGDDEMPLDEALALYEEAVSLGLAASDLIERDIAARRVDADQTGADDAANAVAPTSSADESGRE